MEKRRGEEVAEEERGNEGIDVVSQNGNEDGRRLRERGKQGGDMLSTRYLTKLVDARFDSVKALAVEEEKLIKCGDMLPGHAIRVSEAAIEVVSGTPGSMREGIGGPTPGKVDSRRLAGTASSSPADSIPLTIQG